MTEPGSDPANQDLRGLINEMPKAELHLHLDGSLRIDTALELARTRGVDAPETMKGMAAALIAPARTASQAELLERFELPIALLQDAEALERVTEELVETKADDHVRYLEIRWGPTLHTRRGLGLSEGVAAVCRGAAAGAARTGTAVALICTALRSAEPTANVELAETAGRFRDSGLVGFDLAGPEAEYPDPLVFRQAFEAARSAGLRITLHAGEWDGPQQVWRALELDPERIAHGPTAVADPVLIEQLIRRSVTLEMCPTSNVQVGIVASIADHPLARLHRAGVSVTLSTDDATVSNVSLSDEYERAVRQAGLTLAELWSIDRHSLDVAFSAPEVLAPLRSEFYAWASAHPIGGR